MKEFTYFLKFENGLTFKSPDVRVGDPLWVTEFSEEPVMEFYFRVGHHIFALQGFEKYNFFLEASQSFGGGNASTRIERIMWCGAHQGKVCLFSANMRNHVVEKFITSDGMEYAGGATRGWRPGVFGKYPHIGYENLGK